MVSTMCHLMIQEIGGHIQPCKTGQLDQLSRKRGQLIVVKHPFDQNEVSSRLVALREPDCAHTAM